MTPSEVEQLINQLEETGDLPTNLPASTVKEVSKSLSRYFTQIGQDKISEFTDKAKDLINDALNTEQVERVGAEQTVTEGESRTSARGKLLDFLEDNTGANIGETMDLDFFLRIPMEVAEGAAQMLAQNWDNDRVNEFPGLELRRVYDRNVPRGSAKDPAGPENGWDDDDGRWSAACDEVGDDDAAQVFESTGRMVALKSSGVWQALGDGAGGYDDTLGNPYAPFAFNSGMATDEISHDECVELGLMDEDEKAEPAELDLSDLLSVL